MLFIIVLLIAFKKILIDTLVSCFRWIAAYCCSQKLEEDVLGQEVREALGSYWQSLTGDDQKIWYASEIYSKYRFDISSVEDDALE